MRSIHCEFRVGDVILCGTSVFVYIIVLTIFGYGIIEKYIKVNIIKIYDRRMLVIFLVVIYSGHPRSLKGIIVSRRLGGTLLFHMMSSSTCSHCGENCECRRVAVSLCANLSDK